MAKKTHADIMEKLGALKPSEPTKTRGKPARKTAAAKKAAPPKAQPAVKRPGPASGEVLLPGFGGAVIFGDASKTLQGVMESWFQIVRSCSGAAADCSEIYLRSLSYFVSPGRWWRL